MFLLTLLPYAVSAQKIDGIWYDFFPSSKTAQVHDAYDAKGAITIPSSIYYEGNYYSVTSIRDGAFETHSKITSITIPNSVTSIGRVAFSGCRKLTQINIPNSVISIGSSAFDDTPWYNNQPDGLVYVGKVAYDYKGTMPVNTTIILKEDTKGIADGAFKDCSGLISIFIPNSVTTIGDNAFYRCSSLTSVTIPGSVTYIGYAAFSSCNSLTTATIKDGVTYISRTAFQCCKELTSVIIPNSLTSIDDFAFDNCSCLTSISIPNSVTSIKRGAFSFCSGLTSITIPSSVITIGEYAFQGCSGLSSISVDSDNPQFDSRNNCNALIRKSNNSLIAGCKNTIIPNSVSSIVDRAFMGRKGLTSIIIPNSVTYIGEYAFSLCSDLISITIPNSVTSIDREAFSGCSNLISVTLGSNLSTISENAFSECPNLQEMILPQSIYDKGLPASVTKFTTYSKNPMLVEVTSKTATSATIRVYPFNGQGETDENIYYTVTMQGLTPGQNIKWKLDDENYGIVSEKTPTLTLSTQPAKPTSITKARLFANVNEADDDVHFGFEWPRYDAPEAMTPNRVPSPLYNGQIIGSLGNLNPDKYYKYRPYYKADDGTMFYGDWEVFLTGDAYVFYEAETHTREAAMVTEAGAQLVGVWIEGTEDTMEKGFEYWTVSKANTRTVGNDVKTVTVSGNQSSVSIDGLVAGKEYGYRTYVKTESGTTYGEEKIFKTLLMGDVNHDDVVDAADIVETVNAMNGRPSVNFFLPNADLNGNNQADADDVKVIADIIMGK